MLCLVTLHGVESGLVPPALLHLNLFHTEGNLSTLPEPGLASVAPPWYSGQARFTLSHSMVRKYNYPPEPRFSDLK